MMAALMKKIDFIGFISVTRANPNGDPINGNRPRTDYSGYGEMSAECIKRKIRNRLQDEGEKILVQSNDRIDDDYKCIRDRISGNEKISKLSEKKHSTQEFIETVCEEWTDVRAFGQVFALKKSEGANGVSIGIRGPVSIHPAVSLDPVPISSMKITKSTNTEPSEKRGPDTMGERHRVDYGVYKLQGAINVQLAERTSFSEEDAVKIKEALCTIFENDASSARPEGSMEMSRFYWIEHANKTGCAPSAKIHRSVSAQKKDGVETPSHLDDYIIDDSALYAIDGIHIEKYVEGSLVD